MLFQRCRTAINIWKRQVPVVRDHTGCVSSSVDYGPMSGHAMSFDF